jgi:hypothetical protein
MQTLKIIMLVQFIIASMGITPGCNKAHKQSNETPYLNHQNAVPPEKNTVQATGNKRVDFPGEDPGAPLYLRLATLKQQFFISGEWLIIPFYRDPGCVRNDFNLLQLFDVPAAFSCTLLIKGYYITEKDAGPATFPKIVQSSGSAIPFWLVKWSDFQSIAADDVVTIEDLRQLNPVMGTATKFTETLRPRIDDHFVQISASGMLTDGRSFDFHVTHTGEVTKNIQLVIK